MHYIFLPEGDIRLQVVTVATRETDGYERFMRSAKMYDLNVEVMILRRGNKYQIDPVIIL